ncbi:FHA domain-containing protein [Trichocoleus sp. DQ-A3]|uniref:FHA domain-containing protein n=1 Tax=Cyanophyceae TaxID=3028117 RepID=UPI001688FD64|nr:FHA domain-containing protein [Coleofasciculus sp. FACHB-125]MBD1898906.1 FHA domain-containing protein [Coleofasciculus sp. FACHB-125]
MPQPYLFINDIEGQRKIPLGQLVYLVGRDYKCDIRLVSTDVSRLHATLIQLPKKGDIHSYRIVDGNLRGRRSGNGILINGEKVQSQELKEGDVITFSSQATALYCY